MLKIYVLATHEEHIEYVGRGYSTANRSPAIMAAEMPPATGSVTSQASTMLRNMDQSTFSRARNRPTNTTEPTCSETHHTYNLSIYKTKVVRFCLSVYMSDPCYFAVEGTTSCRLVQQNDKPQANSGGGWGATSLIFITPFHNFSVYQKSFIINAN